VASPPHARTARPVFVTESRTRVRLLRAAGAVLALLAILWLVALGFSLTGVGPLGKIDLPGVPGSTERNGARADHEPSPSGPAGLPFEAPAGVAAADGAVAPRPSPGSAREPSSRAPRSPSRPDRSTTPLPGTGSLTSPSAPSTTPSAAPPAAGTTPRGQGTAKETPGDVHSGAAPAGQTAPGQERKVLLETVTSP
jgi:hypothetical protein